jgi:hypothetical protein
MFIPADGEAAQRIADEAYTGADEMAAAMTLNGANEEEIEALYEMARFLESQAVAKAYGEIEQESGPESLSLEEQASEAKQSLTDAGAPEEMVRHVEQTLLTPATRPELPLDPRTLHADLPH